MMVKRIFSLVITIIMTLCSVELTLASDNTICTLSVGKAVSIYNTSDSDDATINIDAHGDEEAVINYVVYYSDNNSDMERMIPAHTYIYCPAGAKCQIELVSGSFITVESDYDCYTYEIINHSPIVEYTISHGERIRAHNIGNDDGIEFASNSEPVEVSFVSYDGEKRFELFTERDKVFEESAISFFDIFTTTGGDIDIEVTSGPEITAYGAYENFRFEELEHELFKEFEIAPGESLRIKHNVPDPELSEGGGVFYKPDSEDEPRALMMFRSFWANGDPYFLWSEQEVFSYKYDVGFGNNGHYVPPCGTVDWIFLEGKPGRFFCAYENYELVTSTEANTTYSDEINNSFESEPLSEEEAVVANSLGINSDAFVIESSNSDTLKGPLLTVGGKKFNLFEFPLNFKIKTPVGSVKYNHKEEKFEIMIGAIDKTKLLGEDKIHETFMEIKEFANTFGKTVGKSAWKKYDHIKRLLKRDKIDLGFEFNATLVGYMEFDKHGNPLEGTLMYLMEADASYKQYLPPAPVCYVKVGLKTEANGKWGFKLLETNDWSMVGALGLELAPYVGLGVGESKLVNAEIGAKLKLKAELELLKNKKMEDIFEATMTGSLYFKLKALSFFSFERDFDIEKVSLYPDFGASLMSVEAKASQLSVMPRDFYASQSSFMANQVSKQSTDDIALSTFLTNVYPYAQPQFVSLSNGKKLVVWVDTDENRTDINATVLKYSYYNGEEWSEPADIYNNGCAEFSPSLAATSNGAVLVWQKANCELSDDATLEEMAKEMDIYFAEFSDECWSEPYQLTQYNEDYEFAPVIATNSDSYVVAWTTNSENDCFAISGANTLWCREFTDGWKENRRIATGLGFVSNVAVAYPDENYAVSYTVNTDPCIETDDKIELFEYYDGQIVRVTKDSVGEYSLTATDGGYCWIHENQMWERNSVGVNKIDIPVPAIYLENAKIYADDTKRIIVYEQAEGFSTELYAIYYDSASEKWGEPIRLTNDSKKIQGTSGYIDSDGKLNLMFTQSDIDEEKEEIFGTCNLMQLSVGDRYDVTVEDAVCYVPVYYSGADATVYVDVKNNSTVAIDNFEVTLESDGKTLISSDVVKTILPGATEKMEIYFKLGEDLSHRIYNVKVVPKKYADSNLSDNQASIETGFADLAVEASVDGNKVNVVIANIGVLSAKNAVCTLKDTDGTVIDEKAVGLINAGGIDYVTFENLTSETFAVELTTDSEENAYSNNNITLHLNSLEMKGVNVALGEYTATSEKLSVSATIVNDSNDDADALACIAYYKGDKLIGVKCSEIAVGAGESDTILDERPSSEGVDEVKMFVWHSAGKLNPYNKPVELDVVYPKKSVR